MKRVLNSSYFFWLILALPATPMLSAMASGSADLERLLHPTGEFAARFMIIAMLISPLRLLFPKAKWLFWLMQRRRHLGAVLTLVHWIFVHNNLGPALVHFLPLAGLEAWRIWKTYFDVKRPDAVSA